MSYNPFLDPDLQEKMDRFKRTVDSSAVHTDIIMVSNTEDDIVVSPFDRIRHYDDDEGQEYWEARELQGLLGYTEWRKFERSIKRAMQFCRNMEGEEGVTARFVDTTKTVFTGSGVQRKIKDYRLTRYACYLTAINGDPFKPEIAAAQTYFAIRTR